MHMRERQGRLAEEQHELAQFGGLDLVEALTIDVLHQQLAAGDLEPSLSLVEIIDLGDRRMVQLLGGLELGLRLLDVDLVLGFLLADDLQSVALASGGLVADQKDLASRALAELVDHAVLHSGKPGRARDVRHSEPLQSNSGFAFTRGNTSSGCACVSSGRGPASRDLWARVPGIPTRAIT